MKLEKMNSGQIVASGQNPCKEWVSKYSLLPILRTLKTDMLYDIDEQVNLILNELEEK